MRVAWAYLGSILVQIYTQSVVDIEQVVSVLPRIPDHLRWKRSHPPIGQLILLVSVDLAVDKEEVGEAGGAELKDARGLASIEDVDHIKPKVSLQPLHVMICSMQYLHHRRVVKHRAQSLTQLRLQRKRVHQKVFLPRTHLHQTSYAQITARLMVLQIDSDLTLSCDSGYQLSQSVLVVHKSERSLIQRLCGLRLGMLVKRSVIVCFLQLLDLILVGVW